MDELDVDILRHSMYVATDPTHAARGLLGPWQIAKRVGVHGTTVKARLASLRARTVLRGVILAPHLSLLGTRVYNFRFAFDSPARKDSQISALSGNSDAYSVRDFVGNELWVGVMADDHSAAYERARSLARETGAHAPEMIYESRPPPIDLKPRPVDLRILHALAPDAHRNVESIAQEARASSRTVRRRLARLSSARAYSILLNIDVGSMTGAVTILLEVRLAPGASATPVLNAFPEWAHREVARDDLILLYMSAPDLARIQDVCRRASGLPGVVSTTPRFLLSAGVNPKAIQKALEKEMD